MIKTFKFILVLVLFVNSSCTNFNTQKLDNPLDNIDTVIDFNSVDAFPLFPECEDIPSRQKQQICFQLTMAEHIYAELKKQNFKVEENVIDTVLVSLKINSKGKTEVTNISSNNTTRKVLPQLDSIVKASIKNLPKLKPAIKRNIPVTTAFTLPIILKSEN